MRIYAQHLPATFPLTPYMSGQYAQLAKALRAQGIPFIDMDEAFRAHPLRDSDTPLFLRLDTHWSPTGVVAGAEAIKAGIDADPRLKAIVDALPERKYVLLRADSAPSGANDLVAQLPPGSPRFEPERIFEFQVKSEAPAASLLGEAPAPGITLVGSSYSADWTRFADALRYALQRDVLAVSVPASQGQWIGMESYLRDDAFQTSPPKLIIWELPERDLRSPPNYRYREARYRVDETEWLLRAAAWAQRECLPAKAAVTSSGKVGEAVEITLSRPLEQLEYLSAKVVSHGATRMQVEAGGPRVPARHMDTAVPGDEAPHAFRLTLPRVGANGYDRIRLVPGPAHKFSVEEARICRQPEDLLK
jgi:alginate O-acetyltransferase complex protein AlgJ